MTDAAPEGDHSSESEQVAQLRHELAAAQNTIRHLEQALVGARRIGAAVGIIMARQTTTYDAAFDVLVTASKAQNRKLRVIADEVVLYGTLIERPL
jgi:AmiR/NasT family two-component response regulator